MPRLFFFTETPSRSARIALRCYQASWDIVPPAHLGTFPGPPPCGTWPHYLPRETSMTYPKEPPQLVSHNVEEKHLYYKILVAVVACLTPETSQQQLQLYLVTVKIPPGCWSWWILTVGSTRFLQYIRACQVCSASSSARKSNLPPSVDHSKSDTHARRSDVAIRMSIVDLLPGVSSNHPCGKTWCFPWGLTITGTEVYNKAWLRFRPGRLNLSGSTIIGFVG